jgi:hypothetical protein
MDNQEPYPPQDLIKWMKKEESRSRQERWKRGENEMKNWKTSVSWQNDTVKLSRREQVITSRLRTEYTRATHRHIIEKTDTPNYPFCDVLLTTDHILWQCSETCNERNKCSNQCTVWKEGREGSKKLVEYVRKIGFFSI